LNSEHKSLDNFLENNELELLELQEKKKKGQILSRKATAAKIMERIDKYPVIK
jgi:hypothetical protein